MNTEVKDSDLPALYKSADSTSNSSQKKYFIGIGSYLILILLATFFTFVSDNSPNQTSRIISAVLFFITLAIMVWLKVTKPDDIWYNARAVAESVKTRAWRWMLKASPYEDSEDPKVMSREFVKDLTSIFSENKSLVGKLNLNQNGDSAITEKMIDIRALPLAERLSVYRENRIINQELWYFRKARDNKFYGQVWFGLTILTHSMAILLLLINIANPELKMPIEIVAVGASGILTWLQAKKHNELASSYTLTFHEIMLIKSEVVHISTQEELSTYIINCENAFSREHTQWVARKDR